MNTDKRGRTLSLQQQVIGALAKATEMDLAVNAGRLARTAKALIAQANDKAPDLIEIYYGHTVYGEWNWYTNDWRGKRGQAPTDANIRETWGKWNVEKKQSEPAGYQGLRDYIVREGLHGDQG